MQDLLVSARARIGHGCWHLGDLVWRLFLHTIRYDPSQTLRLWADESGHLLGFAIVTPPPTGREANHCQATLCFDWQIHPQARGCGLEENMLDWIESLFDVQPGKAITLSTELDVFDDDASQMAALERRGFQRHRRSGFLWLRSLDGTLPVFPLPPGFAVRSVDGPAEVEQRAAAHRDAFHPSRITDQHYLRLMQTPGYVPHFDLVAVGPDGTFQAFCLGWLDATNKVGEFEPVGTRSAYRRRGMARALMREGLGRMQEAGAESVVVGPVYADNSAAVSLYQSLGLRPIKQVFAYEKSTSGH